MSDPPPPFPRPDNPLEQVQHNSPTARVPDPIGRGVFATGVIVLRGPNEYAIDFVQSLARPSRVAAGVVLAPAVAGQLVIALEQAIEKYTASFGQPPQEPQPVPPRAVQAPLAAGAAPHPRAGAPAAAARETGNPASQPAPQPPPAQQPPSAQQPPIAEVYDSLKLPDELLGGAYANMASITHNASEFCFDFIAQFYPRSVVTTRIYIAAPRAADLLGSLKRSMGTR